MKKTVLLIIITGLFLACEVSAQVPGDTLWTRIYDGGFNMDDCALSVQNTTDGGYIFCGYTWLSESNSDIFLLKTDEYGDTLWTRKYGRAECDKGESIQQTSDGGYIIAGQTLSYYPFNSDFYVIKTDSNGDTIWTKTYGGSDSYTEYEEAKSIYETSDGGYIIAGLTSNFITNKCCSYVVKTNALGDTLWTKTYVTGNGDISNEVRSIQQTDDGGYILCGSIFLDPSVQDMDMYLIKTDDSGEILWKKNFGNIGSGWDEGRSVQQTADGGYILGGCYDAGEVNNDMYLVKTDSFGDTLWTRRYGGSGMDEVWSVRQTTDDGFIVAGFTVSFGAGEKDVYILKTDSFGDTLWTMTYGGISRDNAYSITETSDGGYIVAGETKSFLEDDYDVLLLKIAGDAPPPPQNLFVTEKAYANWDAPSSKDLLGYNIYLDSNFIEYTTDLFYQYEDLIEEQTYIAGVSAVYDEGESEIVEFEFSCIFTGIESNITPDTELLGNFPNPFNSSTTISFSVEGSDKNTKITIYNFNEQKIKTLVDKRLSTGTHQIVWDGTDDSGNQVSSGIYFYKMECGNKYTGLKKMILMK